MKSIGNSFLLPTSMILLVACFTSVKSNTVSEQTHSPVEKSLYDTILQLDSSLFDAFNHCNLEKFKNMFSADLEFFHDNGGLTNYEQTIESVKNNCSRPWKLRRELVAGSVEVYPIKDYGAIQTGSHRFYNTEKGPEELGGTFKFLHVWQKKEGAWKISRVISYGH